MHGKVGDIDMFTLRETIDAATGVSIRSIGASGVDTGHHYFTAMSWMSDSRHIVVCTDIDGDKMGVYVKADTTDGSGEIIVDRLEWGRGLISDGDRFYYYAGPDIYELDLVSGRSRTVCRLDPEAVVYGPLSITKDGSTMGIYWRAGGQWVIGTVDVETGRVREVATPGFAEPYPIANHAMISPEDRNLLFFAHEGQTEYIPDRIYMADVRSGEFRCGFGQKRMGTGELGEYVGHEMWAPDGRQLYFVKYPHSPLKPTGIYRVDARNGEAEFVNGDYRYWHVAVSPDGRWAVADTTEEEEISKIVLIDLASRSSRLLCEIPMWRQHPGHPHPSFSPDSRKISFTLADEERKLRVGIIDIAE